MTTLVQEDNQINRLILVKKSYLVGFFGSIIIVLLGLLTSFIINEFYPLGDTTISLLQAFSIVPGSAALFGVPGESRREPSAAEHLSRKLFTRFSIAGLFLPVMAFSLQSVSFTEPHPIVDEQIFEKLKSDIIQELALKNNGASVQYFAPETTVSSRSTFEK